MNKKIFVTAPLIAMLFVALALNTPNPFFPTIRMAWCAGTPDVFGSRIVKINCQQFNGSDWVYFKDYYSFNGGEWFEGADTAQHEYVANQTWWRVVDAGPAVGAGCTYPLKFGITVFLNHTFASDETEAEDYTRTYWNITKSGYSLTNQQPQTWVGSEHNVTYWKVVGYYTWNVTGHPEAGATYNMAIRYEAYY